ncbi:hypothetical protein [Kitasatospora aureofaciens]|uniref:WapI family immunity protein n=1 Tax=Kitasatospora aureofaciens TaxID=1894 RepID=UPI001C49262A|nr:hypothetical protein [Kitasatospora aureofaciens]MBV6703299.1 hypothetical protein [Kitasatospora aureofaciens]
MILTGSAHHLDLRPLCYQFGAARGEDHDDNWLVITGRAAAPEGSWRFVEACLLTWEAQGISRWLRTVAEPNRTPRALDFLEPLLTFSLPADQPADGRRLIHVRFALEAAPPWVDTDDEEDGDGEDDWPGYTAEFLLTPAELHAAADAWDADLAPFPTR